MASDPALLLAAAVKAACHLKAPRRTIVAVAAAVAAALMQPVTVAASKATGPGVASGSRPGFVFATGSAVARGPCG